MPGRAGLGGVSCRGQLLLQKQLLSPASLHSTHLLYLPTTSIPSDAAVQSGCCCPRSAAPTTHHRPSAPRNSLPAISAADTVNTPGTRSARLQLHHRSLLCLVSGLLFISHRVILGNARKVLFVSPRNCAQHPSVKS